MHGGSYIGQYDDPRGVPLARPVSVSRFLESSQSINVKLSLPLSAHATAKIKTADAPKVKKSRAESHPTTKHIAAPQFKTAVAHQVYTPSHVARHTSVEGGKLFAFDPPEPSHSPTTRTSTLHYSVRTITALAAAPVPSNTENVVKTNFMLLFEMGASVLGVIKRSIPSRVSTQRGQSTPSWIRTVS